jgi:hypothetical protein
MGATSSVNNVRAQEGVRRDTKSRVLSVDDMFHDTFGDYVIDSNSLRLSDIDSATPEQRIVPKTDSERTLIQNGLKGNFIFDSLSQQQLDRIIDVFRPVKCAAGETIIQQGASGGLDHMYVNRYI